MKKRTINSFFFLNLALALMLIATGILGITNYNSNGAEFIRGVNKAFGGSNSIIPILMAIIELAAGIILVIGLFDFIPKGILGILLLVIFIFWAVNIFMGFILNDIFEPDFFTWLAPFSAQLIILVSLWIVYRNNN